MQRRLLTVAASATFLLIILGIGCTKLDTTTLGSDLVTVDNVNTFADTLIVNAAQGIFSDSTSVYKTENHVIGNITTDLLFGNTDAAIYLQFKPTFYPFYFGNAGDTVKYGTSGNASIKAGFDSAFICLSYKGAWGDTTAMGAIPQEFRVLKIDDVNFRLKTDTVRNHLAYKPTTTTLLGDTFITPAIVKNKVILARGRDSVVNQIRIKLTGAGASLAADIFNLQDSTATGTNNAFYNDSIFRSKFNGFAITVNGPGNTLFYVNLAEAKSRMEFHFHKVKNNFYDTIVQSFQMYTASSGSIAASSSANYVGRNRSGRPVLTPDANNIYLQTAPGTFANLSIPQLTGYSNRIIHRAYLIVEQTPDVAATDNIFTAPPNLYLDLKDTSTSIPQKYKPVYFDLTSALPYDPDVQTSNGVYHPYPYSNVDVTTFGGNAIKRYETSGLLFYRYEINLTRYVQHIVTNGYKNYNLRLYAPYNYYYPQYSGTQYIIPYFNPVAFGRVRVGSGTNPLHKMKMVVIYSKI